MYKVFNDNIPLILHSEIFHLGDVKNVLYLKYEDKEEWNYIIQNVWKNEGVNTISIFSKELEKSWGEFKNYFNIVMAAGGIVKNEKDEYLVIERNGYLDLPKGHIEKDELSKDAALREVAEECGLKNHKIQVSNPKFSYHIYPLNNVWILKKTYWYSMTASLNESLLAQKEEGITGIMWMSAKEILKNKDRFYQSLLDLIV